MRSQHCLRLVLLMTSVLASVFSIASDQTFRDSAGRYSLRIPQGWTLHDWSGGLMMKGNKVQMDLNFMETRMEPMLFMATKATGIQNNWKDVITVSESEGTISGNKSLIHILQGTDRGVSKLARLVSFNAGHGVYCFVSEIAFSDEAELFPVIEAVEQSFREGSDQPAPPLKVAVGGSAQAKSTVTAGVSAKSPEPPARTTTGTSGVSPSPGSNGSLYRDPKGRFEIAAPAGWTAATAGEGAVVSQGSAYVNVIVIDGMSSGAEFLLQIAQQYKEQWKDFRTLQSGDWTLGGIPGKYGMYSGVNPQGTQAILRIVAAAQSGSGFLMLTSVPQSDWEHQKSDLQKVEQGFSTGKSRAAIPVEHSKEPTYQRYESQNPAFGLLEPAGWSAHHEATADSLLISVSDPAGTSVVQTYFGDNRQRRLDAVSLLASLSRVAKAQYGDLLLRDVTVCKDKSCIVANETYTRDGTPVKARVYIQSDPRQVVVRSYRAPAASFDLQRNMLLEILSSTRLGKPGVESHRGEGAATPAAVLVQLVNRRAPDGSVSLNLPADWSFQGGGGKVLAGEPGVGLGFIFTNIQVMPKSYGVAVPPGVMISAYRPPASFIYPVFEKFGNRDIQVIGSQPDTQTMNECPREIRTRCDAADLVVKWVSPKGVACIGGFKMVNGAPNLAGQWFSIVTGVWAPAKDFGRYLPMLEQIAASFSINNHYSGQYVQNGLANLRALQQKTQESMRDLSNAVSQNQKDWESRQAIRDNSDSKWDDYSRGNSYWISDIEGGKVYQSDTSGIQDLQSGDRTEGGPYSYVHFEGQNPRYPSENMRELSSYEVQQMMAAPQ